MTRASVTGAREAADHYRRRRERFSDALRRGLRQIGLAGEQAQIENLSGSGGDAAGNYPIPVRKGHLRRGADWGPKRPVDYVDVFNTAGYAVPVHEGHGSSSRYGPRRFVGDVPSQIDAGGIMAIATSRALA